MNKKKIIAQLKSIANNKKIKLSDEQHEAIRAACKAIPKAKTSNDWFSIIQKLWPFLIALGANIFKKWI